MKINEKLSWLSSAKGQHFLKLYIQVNAKKTAFVGVHAEHLKLRVAAPAIDGAANAAMIAFIAKTLQLRKIEITIKNGEFSKYKTLQISGINLEQIKERVETAITSKNQDF